MSATRSDGLHASDVVREAARLREPDRYLAALLAPRSVRRELVALAAFSAELLHARDIVRDPMIGEIRLQWWRDALLALARGERTANPVADALGAAMHRHNLAPAMLQVPIEARSRELQAIGGADEGREIVAAKAEETLFRAALSILTLPDSAASDAACVGAGVAYGIARQVYAVRTTAPGHGSSPHDRMQAIRNQAREALVTVRLRVDELDPRALVAFLPLVMVEPYLRAQEQGNANNLGHTAYITPLRRIWRIWRAKRRRRL
jgi:15-cis-phytoene synthase